MSLNEFKSLCIEGNRNELRQYVKDNKEALLKIESNDLYGILLKTICHRNMKYFVDAQLPWKELMLYNQSLSWKEVQLQSEDLSETRMTDCPKISLYTDILKHFLVNHEVEEIPVSFLEHKITDPSLLIRNVSCYIDLENVFFTDIQNKNTNINKKFIIVFCYFFETYYDQLKARLYVGPQTNQEDTYHEIIGLFYSFFDRDNGEIVNNGYFSYKSIKVDQNNIIELFFDIEKKFDGNLRETTITWISNYFEWMSIDQQLIFWNLINNNNKYDAIRITMFSTSSTFIDFAFDHIPNCYESICDGIDKHRDAVNLTFWKSFQKKFPDLKNYVFTYLALWYNHADYLSFFEDMPVQELMHIIKEVLF